MRTAALVAMAALCGCGGGAKSTRRHDRELATGKPIALVSAAELCKPWAGKRELTWSLPPRDLVGRMMCNARYQGGVGRGLYEGFDEQMFGHFSAALMVVDCVGGGVCAAAGPQRSPVAIGALAYYAKRIDGPSVMAALGALDVPAQMRTDFMDRLAASQREVLTLASRLDGRRRELYVALPARVRARRAAERKSERLGPLYGRAKTLAAEVEGALKGRTASRDHVARVRALREDFVRACEAGGRAVNECLAGPVARPMTELLVRLAIALRDPVLGHAENALLEVRLDLTRVQAEIYLEQAAAMAAERARWNEFNAAARTGVDARMLAATTGAAPPVDLGNEQPLAVNAKAISWRPVLERLEKDRPVLWLRGEVAAVSRGGDSSQVRFRGAPEPGNKKTLMPWVRVPTADVRAVRAGMWLVAVADAGSKAGLVASVRETEAVTSRIIQRRGFAMSQASEARAQTAARALR